MKFLKSLIVVVVLFIVQITCKEISSALGKKQDHQIETTDSKFKSDLAQFDYDDDERECSEGQVMTVVCNSCVCINGHYVCSKKECEQPMRPLVPQIYYNSKKNITYKKPGTINQFVDTGDDEEDSLNPTKLSGKDTAVNGDCVDGRIKRVDCNHCICLDGTWGCTKDHCIALTLREKASYNGADFLKKVSTLVEQPIDEDCVEENTKEMLCNRCVCHRNAWACTDKKCPPPKYPTIGNGNEENQKPQEPCKTEEDVKSKECNICSCRKGVWVCTQNDCKQFGNRYYHPVVRTRTGLHKY